MMKLVVRVSAGILLLSGIAAASLWAQQRADADRVRQRLIGSYKLISYTGYDQNGTATKLPYAAGQISYDAAGRMSAQLMQADRPRFTPGSPAPEAARAAAYSTYI